jgi:hypothetical protein
MVKPSGIFGLYSATARHASTLAAPTATEEEWYTREFPYYAELAALSEIRKKPGFEVPLRSGIGGHSLLYLNGVRRDRDAGYPVLKLAGAEQAVGISVNSHYRNANWVAADGPEFLWRGALATDESLTRAGYERTQALAKNLGVLDGVEFHEHFFRDKPETMAARDYMYEISVGTDYAALFGRDVFRARIPLDRARMQAIVDYLNGLNAPYRDGGKKFIWKLFNDNCCHVAHNALAAAGIWAPCPTGKFVAFAAFNFPVPKNELVDLLCRANDLPIANPSALYKDKAARRALLESGTLPTAPGAIVIASPAIAENAVYDIDRLKLIFFDNPFWGPYRTRLKRILGEPRYANLRANLKHFETVYANAQANIARAKSTRAKSTRAKNFDLAYAQYIAREAARGERLLASLDHDDKMPVEIPA